MSLHFLFTMLLLYTYYPSAKLSHFYWRAFVGCGDPDAPMPRQRHEIFGKVCFAYRRGELRSPIENPHKF